MTAAAQPKRWCKKSSCCGEEAGHRGACNMNGVDVRTWRRIKKMPVPEFGDHWSCCMRPGSWEWSTEDAIRMRFVLEQAGYEQAVDPNRPYGTAWVRR